MNHYKEILNYFDARSSNASAELQSNREFKKIIK
nr:hypothetical protein [Chryseobacterium piscicola]